MQLAHIAGRHVVRIVGDAGRDEGARLGVDDVFVGIIGRIELVNGLTLDDDEGIAFPLDRQLEIGVVADGGEPPQFAILRRVWVFLVEPRREELDDPSSFRRRRRVECQERAAPLLGIGRPDPAERVAHLGLAHLRGFVIAVLIDKPLLCYIVVRAFNREIKQWHDTNIETVRRYNTHRKISGTYIHLIGVDPRPRWGAMYGSSLGFIL